MKVADFDYELPPHFIAQKPAEPRDSAKLMHLDRHSGRIAHHRFSDIAALLQPGDVLVMNNTRVMPARLPARKAHSGGKVEILLLRQIDERHWHALVGGRKVNPGAKLELPGGISCRLIERLVQAKCLLQFDQPIKERLAELGRLPLPPYIHSAPADDERYQTVYSQCEGSAAAPTAGLHFTPQLLRTLQRKCLQLAYCTLHIGLDTFQPVKSERVRDHKIHSEFATLDRANARRINTARAAGKRIIAVGTPSARTLEPAAILRAGGDPAQPPSPPHCRQPVRAFAGDTRLFIYPGYQWRAVDAIITNFHLPKSTLLMMLSAFAGRASLLAAYEQAKQADYRFYSFGDAMLIT